MLELFNIDESQLRQFEDGRPLDSSEDETLFKLLYRIPQFGQDRIETWQRKDVPLSDLVAEPAAHRIDFFRVEGRARGLQRIELLPEAAERLEYSHYYRVNLQHDGLPNPIEICTRIVPQAWLGSAAIDENVSFYGLFLKLGENESEPPPLIFAADRIAWHPNRVELARGIGPSQVLLGSAGMDVGLFDEVRNTNRKTLGQRDREGFYQLLAATGKLPADVMFSHHEGGFDLEPMLTRPETQHGRLVRFRGTARKVQKIMVGDEDIQQRFGIDHYYQIDVFVPLGDEEVRLGRGKPGEEAPIFRNSYPVQVCVLNLPRDFPVGEEVYQEIDIAGFYFKLWAYKTEFVSAIDDRQRQVGPLFVAATPYLYERPMPSMTVISWMVGGGFLTALVGIALAAWLFRRGDRKFERRVLRPQFDLESGRSLDDLSRPPGAASRDDRGDAEFQAKLPTD
jgi:hypothetical protein